MVRVSASTESVPSLPQTLVAILDASDPADADFAALGHAILQDGGMATRLVAAANSPAFYRSSPCRTVDRALLTLGLDTVRDLALTAAIQQLFGQYRPRHREYLREIWRRALTTAHMGQVLATLTRYPRPEEAYLAGLLVDLGRLIRLSEDEGHYWPLLQGAGDDHELLELERAHYDRSHAELAADHLESWGLGTWIADAVRYHLAPAEQVRDAHQLVKLVNLASALGPVPGGSESSVTDAALAAAHTLFDLNEGLTRELRGRIDKDVARIAGSLGIELGDGPGLGGDEHTEYSPERRAEAALGERVRDLTEIDRLNGVLARSDSVQACSDAVRRSLFLTLGVEQSLLFLRDAGGASLSVWMEDDEAPEFTLPLLPGRSLVTDTLLDRESRRHERTADGVIPVVDQQLFRVCRSEILWAFPLVDANEEPVGVLILGLERNQADALEARSGFIRALSREIARALSAIQPEPPRAPAPATEPGVSGEMIRETLHEAGTPLSIIQNYLGALRMKLSEDPEAQHELGLIREEIDRVGRILMRLRDPESGDRSTPTDLNATVQRVAQVFEGSLGEAHDIRLQLELAPESPAVDVPPDHLRQILTNLLTNAVEAIESGGRIGVRTMVPNGLEGRRTALLSIEDDGPGIPAEVLDAGFEPVPSTKGGGHAGVGLSIVKRLADEAGARIEVQSNEQGTRFELWLPCTPDT